MKKFKVFSRFGKATAIGQQAEQVAKNYLEKQGLKFIDANFKSRFGEIDLIMREQTSLVFVEVRYRKGAAFGGALASVHYFKQEKLRKAALYYLTIHKIYEKIPCRFDVIALEGELTAPKIEWLKNAF